MDNTRDEPVLMAGDRGPAIAGLPEFPMVFWEVGAELGGHESDAFEGLSAGMGTAMFGAPIPRSAVMTPIGLISADDEEDEVLVVGDWTNLS